MQTSFSSPIYLIVMTVVIIALAFVLVSIMRRVVTLLLGRVAPQWIDRVTILLQAAVLVGELAIIVGFIAPSWPIGWLALFLFALVAAALLFGQRAGRTVALPSLKHYPVGPWRMPVMRPLNTRRQKPKQAAIVVTRAPVGTTITDSLVQENSSVAQTEAVEVETIIGVRQPGPPVFDIAVPQLQLDLQPGIIVPLVKRPTLGKLSVRLLQRK